MLSKYLKLLILAMMVVIFFACAHQEPLQLPPSVLPEEDQKGGWHNY